MGRRLTLFLLVLGCCLAWLLAEDGSKPAADAKHTMTRTQRPELQEAKVREQAEYEKQTRARLDQLARMETAKQVRDQLALRGTEVRSKLQAAKSAAGFDP